MHRLTNGIAAVVFAALLMAGFPVAGSLVPVAAPPEPLASVSGLVALPMGPALTPSTSGLPYVSQTIDLRNGTAWSGNFLPGNGRNPYVAAYDPIHKTIYVANDGSDFVSVVDGVTHTVVGYIPVDTQGSWAVCIAGGYLYVAGHNAYLVQVFNTTTWQLVANVSLGTGPLACAYDSRHDRVYMTEQTPPYQVTAISNTNFTIVGLQQIRHSPAAIVYDPVDDELFIAGGGHNVEVLNGTTLAYITNLTVGFEPRPSLWDPRNDRVYFVNQDSQNVSVIDPTIVQVVGAIAIGSEPVGVAMDPTGEWLYIASGRGGNVTKVNTTNLTEHYAIPIGAVPSGIAFDEATGEGMTANYDTNNLTFFNGTTGAIDVVLANGYTPTGMGYDPVSDEVFIAESSGGTVFVWNESQGRISGSVALPGAPTQTSYDAATGAIYVLRPPSGLVSEIDPNPLAIVRNWNVAPGATAFAIVASSDRLYVADYLGLAIDIYRLSDGALLGNFSALSPAVLRYCPGTGTVYAVVGFAGEQVLAIDPRNDSVRAAGAIGILGTAIACDPFSGNIYVANGRTQNVSVLNGTTLAGVTSLPNGVGGAGVAYDSLNGEILATAFDADNATVVGTVNRSLVAIVPVGAGPSEVAFAPANDSFFVANVRSGTISILRPNTPPPYVAFAGLSPSVIYVPTNSSFNVTATTTSNYGIPCPSGVAFAWTASPSYLATPTATNRSTEPFVTGSRTGVGSILVNASFGGTWATASVPLQVTGPPPTPLASASISPTSSTLLVGGSQPFAASALLIGGAPAPPSTTFTWTFTPLALGSLNSTTGTSIVFNANAPGTATLTLSVFYGGSYAFASATITIRSSTPPVLSQLTLAPLDPTVEFGGNLTFVAVAFDAAGNNISALASYHWQLAAPSLGSLAFAPGYREPYVAGTAAGTDVLQVRASLGGRELFANTTITLLAPAGSGGPNGTTSGGSPLDALGHVPWWLWTALGVALVVGIAVVLLRRRPRAPGPPTDVESGPFEATVVGIETAEGDASPT